MYETKSSVEIRIEQRKGEEKYKCGKSGKNEGACSKDRTKLFRTEERNRGRIDNRPSISDINTSLDYNRIIHKDEEEKVIKRIRKNEKEKEKDRKTIMDMPLKDIISKTTETIANFWEDYKIKLIEVKYHYEKKK